jgi:hypothetical protein
MEHFRFRMRNSRIGIFLMTPIIFERADPQSMICQFCQNALQPNTLTAIIGCCGLQYHLGCLSLWFNLGTPKTKIHEFLAFFECPLCRSRWDRSTVTAALALHRQQKDSLPLAAASNSLLAIDAGDAAETLPLLQSAIRFGRRGLARRVSELLGTSRDPMSEDQARRLWETLSESFRPPATQEVSDTRAA